MVRSYRRNISREELMNLPPFPWNRPVEKRSAELFGREWNPTGDTFILSEFHGVTRQHSGHARIDNMNKGGFTNLPSEFNVLVLQFETVDEWMESYHLTVYSGQAASNSDIQYTAASSAALDFQSPLMKSSWKTALSTGGRIKSEVQIENFYSEYRGYLSILDTLQTSAPLCKRLGTGGVKIAIVKLLINTTAEEKRHLMSFCREFFNLNVTCPQVSEWKQWEDNGFPGFLEKHKGSTGNDLTRNHTEMFIKLFREYLRQQGE